MVFSRFLFSSLLAIVFLASLLTAATLLPKDEVDALREIARTLNGTIRLWNFSNDPFLCDANNGGWASAAPHTDADNVTCVCFNDGVCHVTQIVLKSRDLQGTLPKDLSGLPYLQNFDVSRNYLGGPIPSEWGSTQLQQISLLGNRLTGPIPETLANISTLFSFVVEFNQLSGHIPSEIGYMPKMQRLFLSSNNFTGEIPASFANLTTLTDFRIPDTNFTGAVPDFIQNWTNLTKLVIQGSGLSGPIPSGIAQLKKITDLRISDLKGIRGVSFPPLRNMAGLKTLILSSCNITGVLPDYLVEFSELKVMDLSFNSLTGEIPPGYSILSKVQYIYLTGNSLSGEIPHWMLTNAKNVDLSYNNFVLPNTTSECQQGKQLNLFQSYFRSNNSKTSPCWEMRCSKKSYYFHINCGGGEFNNGTTTYEEDQSSAGPSFFYLSKTNWAFSSTGHFLDRSGVDYTESTSSLPANTSQLYTSARLSPLSLTYYGFCLESGNYTVDLHFAEIQFSYDQTYSSLGRRVFDIYIQEELVEKDFNIAVEAGGNDIGIVMSYRAVVNNTTLAIRFHWAGEGTTAIPEKGVYGPLISAISVTAAFPHPSNNEGSKTSLTTGGIVGIVVAGLIVGFLVLGIIWWNCCRERMAADLKSLNLHTGLFSLRQIKAATNNFDPANKIGEGGFGSVYKGFLANGTTIAVKQLSSKSKQGNREFVNEVGMISALQHPHLVQLYGCCIEGNQLLLVYEYMENNSLARALFGPEDCQLKLDWQTRHKICVGIARGLAYIHEESTLKIVHRDIKATNVLLDADLTPKISDFGLAKLDAEDNTHISTRIAGTYGYMAPEYAMRGHLTDKADVYSFGIVALEIVSGRSNSNIKSRGDNFNLLDWALRLKKMGQLLDLVDPRLESNYDEREAMTVIQMGLVCASESPAARPSMSSVVSILEGKADLPEMNRDGGDVAENKRIQMTFRDHLQLISEDESVSESRITADATDYSTAPADLYPITLDSQYLEKRI